MQIHHEIADLLYNLLAPRIHLFFHVHVSIIQLACLIACKRACNSLILLPAPAHSTLLAEGKVT
jgi:hypothetical protein